MEYFSVKEVSDMLSVNSETVRRWIRDGKLDAERGAGRQGSKISSDALKIFLENNKGSITALATSRLGLTTGAAVLGALGSSFGAGAIAAGVTTGALGLAKLLQKDSNNEAYSMKLELIEKSIELEGVAMQLKNDIAIKTNELELVKKQLEKINMLINELK